MASIETLPSSPPGWHDWVPLTRGNPLSIEREFYFPPDMMPSSKFSVVNEYSNGVLWLDQYDAETTSALSFLPSAAGVIASGTGTSVMLQASLSRAYGVMQCGGNDARTQAMKGPKFGFSIGNEFKHQAYVKLLIVGEGAIDRAYRITWLWATCIPKLEFKTNSRFMKFVVDHGEIISIVKRTTGEGEEQEEKTYIKLFNNTKASYFPSPASGAIKVYGKRGDTYSSGTFSFSEVTKDWEAVAAPPSDDSGEASETFSPAPGDFYTLSVPIMCEDPQMMHEFGLTLDDEGMYKTNDQCYTVTSNITGIWVYDVDTQKQVAYADEENRPRIHLPENVAQSDVSGESMEFGGTFSVGLAKWGESNSGTVRLILDQMGGSSSQNFFAGNLVGEYVAIGGPAEVPSEYFLIVDHPRLDTIEVKNEGAMQGAPFLGSSNTQVTVYQQNFWKITELYTGNEASSDAALWSGKIESIQVDDSESNTYKIKWKSKEFASLFLPDSEIAQTGLKTLPERFRELCDPSSWEPGGLPAAVDGYDVVGDWMVIANGVPFKTKSLAVSETDSDAGGTNVEIEATVQGDPSTYAGTGSLIYVVFGEIYKSAYGLSNAANHILRISTDVAMPSTNDPFHPSSMPYLYMHGYYQSGFYELPVAIDPKKRLAIASHMYGVDSADSVMGAPMVWASTHSGMNGTCYIEHGSLNRQSIFYTDPELGVIMTFSADPGWIERRQKSVVRLGSATKVEAGDDIPSDAYLLTGVYGGVGSADSQATEGLKGFWIMTPLTGQNTTPYYSVKIQGFSGITTPLTRKLNASVGTTSAHPVDLPIEVYEPVGEGGTAFAPVAVRASMVDLLTCGFVEINDASMFTRISDGDQLETPTSFYTIDAFEFSSDRQVVKNPGRFNGHSVEDGNVLLFYGKDTGKFFVNGATSEINKSRPSLFAIKSGTNIDSWGSPKFDIGGVRNSTDQSVSSEWERPVLLVYGFEFVDSVQLSNDQFLVFGYCVANDDGQAETEDENRLFLGCYRISMAGMRMGATHKCYTSTTSSDANAPSDSDNLFYYRPNHALSATDGSLTHAMDFGTDVEGIPDSPSGSATDDPTSFCPERFTRIVGGSSSEAIVQGQGLAREIIGASIGAEGVVEVFFRSPQNSRILRLWSSNGGETWQIEKDSSGNPLSYATGSSPTAYGNFIFYFSGDSLNCKVLSSITEGIYPSKQEELDEARTSLIASDVVGHKIAVNEDPHGRTVVFYLSKSGDVCATSSADSGVTWKPLVNW